MSTPHPVSGEAFALERLRTSPDLDFASLRAAAMDAGISLQPIHYGRARKQLGLPMLHDARPEAPLRAAATPAEERTGSPRPTPTPAAPAGPRKGSAAFEFLTQELRREPGLSYGELRDRALAKGFPIAPIMYGRAKAVLGLVPVKPRGSKRAAKAAAAGAATPPPAPRRLQQVESVAADRFSKQLDSVRSLEQLVGVVKDLDAERRRLRAVLENIVTLIDAALDRKE